MEKDDFYRDFMTNVQSPAPARPSHESKKKTWWIIGGITVGLIVVILIIVGVIAIVTRDNSVNSDEEDIMDAEVSDELPEETADIGSAIYYDEDSGEITSIRMGCTNSEKRYDFYRDNTYEISPLHVVEADESGTYLIGGEILILKPTNGPDRVMDVSDLSRLVDGTEVLECEQYDDV